LSEAEQMKENADYERRQIEGEANSLDQAILQADAKCPVNLSPSEVSESIRPARINIDKINPILGIGPIQQT
jgi:hypothetical protein